MRWRQHFDKETQTSTMVPIDEEAEQADRSKRARKKGQFTAFKSIVDGTLISTDRKLKEHNVRNNVVNAAEFTDSYYEKKADERADFYEGRRTTKEIFQQRQEIYETWIRAERNGS